MQLISLARTTKPFIDHFNRNADRIRFLALLSPTGPGGGIQGARAVQQSIIDQFPDTPISINLVWINMLPKDSETTAQKSAASFDDPRVQQFYDPAKRAGQVIAGSVGWKGNIAWDIYLFYKAGPKWEAAPPRPTHWMHQLKDSWADHRYFRTGPDLTAELSRKLNMLFK